MAKQIEWSTEDQYGTLYHVGSMNGRVMFRFHMMEEEDLPSQTPEGRTAYLEPRWWELDHSVTFGRGKQTLVGPRHHDFFGDLETCKQECQQFFNEFVESLL